MIRNLNFAIQDIDTSTSWFNKVKRTLRWLMSGVTADTELLIPADCIKERTYPAVRRWHAELSSDKILLWTDGTITRISIMITLWPVMSNDSFVAEKRSYDTNMVTWIEFVPFEMGLRNKFMKSKSADV